MMEAKTLKRFINQQKHIDLVRRLKAEGFSDPAMLDWKFENDNGRSPQMHHAHRYVEQWQTMRSENLGLLLWGGVGTGKSFLAGCIALVYRVEEIAQLLAISNRAAYNLCNTTKDFRVLRIGTSIRVNKQSFDDWFAAV